MPLRKCCTCMIAIMKYLNLLITTLFTLRLCVGPPTKKYCVKCKVSMIVNPDALENPNLHHPRVIYYVLLVGAAAVAMSWQLYGNWMTCHRTMKWKIKARMTFLTLLSQENWRIPDRRTVEYESNMAVKFIKPRHHADTPGHKKGECCLLFMIPVLLIEKVRPLGCWKTQSEHCQS